MVLGGAQSLFKTIRPMFVMEVSGRKVGKEMDEFLHAHSYVRRPACVSRNIPFRDTFQASDIIAIPKESRTFLVIES